MKRSKILIVEDDKSSAEMLRDLATLRGYDVTISENASDALRRISGCVFDVFLVDFNMPGMSGPELVMHLRARSPGAAIVGMSGFNMAEPFLTAGADRFIQKPFTMERLDQLLREIHPALP